MYWDYIISSVNNKMLYLFETIAADLSATNHTKIEYKLEGWGNVVLSFLYAATITLSFTGVIEFVCAQSPYNMHGLLTGCTVTLSSSWIGFEFFFPLFKKAPHDIKHILCHSLSTAIGFEVNSLEWLERMDDT